MRLGILTSVCIFILEITGVLDGFNRRLGIGKPGVILFCVAMVALNVFEFSPIYSVSINPAAIAAFLVLLMIPGNTHPARREIMACIFAATTILIGISAFLPDTQGILRGLALGVILGAGLSTAASIIISASATIIAADALAALIRFLVNGYTSVEVGLAESFDALIFGIALASSIAFIKLSLKRTAKDI